MPTGLKTINVEELKVNSPVDIFEKSYELECQYRDHIDKIVKLAREEFDELTAIEMAKLLDAQIDSCNDFELYLKKAQQYSAIQGLYYHLDRELEKKAKK